MHMHFEHVTIVNEYTIDKEFDDNVYRKNFFSPHHILMLAMELCMNSIGTVYQSVHTHYLIVGMKIPTYKDISEPPQNGTKTCTFDKTFNFIIWKNLAKGQCNFFNGLFHQLEQQGSHLYTKVFQVLHSDVPALLPNQEIKFLSETEHPLHEEDKDTDVNKTHSKRSTDDILTMPEKHRLESYWSKYHKQLPSDFEYSIFRG